MGQVVDQHRYGTSPSKSTNSMAIFLICESTGNLQEQSQLGVSIIMRLLYPPFMDGLYMFILENPIYKWMIRGYPHGTPPTFASQTAQDRVASPIALPSSPHFGGGKGCHLVGPWLKNKNIGANLNR